MARFEDMENHVVREGVWIEVGVLWIELISIAHGFDSFATWHFQTGWDMNNQIKMIEGASAEEAAAEWFEIRA